MAITCARLNEIPDSSSGITATIPVGSNSWCDLGNGQKLCFMLVTFAAADQYDPTNHDTTKPFLGVAGANPRDLFGLSVIDQIEFSNGSSDAQITTAEVKADWDAAGQFIRLTQIGITGVEVPGPTVAIDEVELPAVANNLTALRLVCEVYGR